MTDLYFFMHIAYTHLPYSCEEIHAHNSSAAMKTAHCFLLYKG